MLLSLSIRDVVLIDKLDLTFQPGLSVLTGETGAGKSILLDALGLALGVRASPSLIRKGASQATVGAAFQVPAGHAARAILRENGLEAGEDIVLRRVVGADGRSRGFVNDQPASVGLMKQLGDALVEIQGQSEARGLMDAASHRSLLDAYGGLEQQVAQVAAAWRGWRQAAEALARGRSALAEARAEEAFLRHAHEELAALDPKPGEEAALADARAVLMHQEKLVEALNVAGAELGAPRAVDDALRAAGAALARVADKAGGRLDAVIAALERAVLETQEALAQLEAAGASIEVDSAGLAEIEERFFALKDVARKHGTGVEELPALRETIAARLAALDDQGGEAERLAQAAEAARQGYLESARALSAARDRAATALDKAMNAELPPLKLAKAAFVSRVEPMGEPGWGAGGIDRVSFEAATNPGAAPGPLARIASGGELSRFMLALKVVLSRLGTAPTLVFDEVDSGIGGATAHAVGERLARLGKELQVLVVTHSPQVAARGAHHWRVVKEGDEGGVVTLVHPLVQGNRREEIARMLSGKRVTDEARAAADSLLAGERV